jgi:hypothetical protein
LVLASTLLVAAAPAFSGVAMQIWRCEMEEGATEEGILANASKWLKAAKTIKGGENLQVTVHFPVAVNATDKVDLLLILTVPTFEEWGRFWDSYIDSPAAEIHSENKMIICPNSVVWQTFKVE